jgi:hypothetical protein
MFARLGLGGIGAALVFGISSRLMSGGVPRHREGYYEMSASHHGLATTQMREELTDFGSKVRQIRRASDKVLYRHLTGLRKLGYNFSKKLAHIPKERFPLGGDLGVQHVMRNTFGPNMSNVLLKEERAAITATIFPFNKDVTIANQVSKNLTSKSRSIQSGFEDGIMNAQLAVAARGRVRAASSRTDFMGAAQRQVQRDARGLEAAHEQIRLAHIGEIAGRGHRIGANVRARRYNAMLAT